MFLIIVIQLKSQEKMLNENKEEITLFVHLNRKTIDLPNINVFPEIKLLKNNSLFVARHLNQISQTINLHLLRHQVLFLLLGGARAKKVIFTFAATLVKFKMMVLVNPLFLLFSPSQDE